ASSRTELPQVCRCMSLSFFLSLPGIADFFSNRLRAFGKISEVHQRLIVLQHCVERYDGSGGDIIRGPPQELPVPVPVMGNREDKPTMENDWFGREAGSVPAFRKLRTARIVEDRLPLLKRFACLRVPGIAVSLVRPHALEGRKVIAFIKPASVAQILLVM